MSYPQFPELKPTSRTVVMADVANTKMRAMDGQIFSVVYADRPTGDRIQLTYRLLRNEALQLVSHYGDCDGTYGVFQVKLTIGTRGADNTFAGMNPNTKTDGLLTDTGTFGQFRYAQPPVMSQVSKTVYEIEIELVKATS